MDLALFHALNGAAGHIRTLDALMRFAAQDSPAVAALALLIAWLAPGPGRRRRQRVAVMAGVAAVAALVLAALIGHVHYRPRPFLVAAAHAHLLIAHGTDSSFPSDHTTLAFAVAVGLAPLGAAWGALLGLFAVWVAVARVFVGVHWPSDVLAGALLGALCAAAARAATPRLTAVLDAAIDRLGPLGGAAREGGGGA
jgi:undecaprenyl-diphosphatase